MKKKKIKNLRTGLFSRSMSLAKLGLQAGTKAAGNAVGGIFATEAVKKLKDNAHLMGQMALLAKELGELKGSFMKAGQMLSVYGEHFLPPEANQLLKTLQNNSVEVEWDEIKKILVRQLGKERLVKLEIDEEAIAAASLGQVHRARIIATKDDIVLKIQYPGVDKAIDGDIKAIRRILSLLDFLPNLPSTDDLFKEIRSMLHRELDYELEVKMLDFFAAALEGDNRYVVPRPFPEFCTKRVIAMTFESGVSVDSAEVKALSQERRNEIAKAVLDLYFRELFVWRKVQTDPHFGNFNIRLGKKTDQLVLFDYGAVREISQEFMDKYKKMLGALYHNDRAAFEIAAGTLGVLEPSDPQALKDIFYKLCSAIMEPFMEDDYDWKKNDLPQRVSKITWELFKGFPLRSPPREIVFLDRKMAGIFTLLANLGAKVNAREILKPFLD